MVTYFCAMARLVGCLFLMALHVALYGNGAPETYVKKIDQRIVIDGNLDEEQWMLATPTTDFWQYFPVDSLISEHRTEVYMLYTEDMLYVAAKCYAPGKDYIIPSLRRDYRAGGNDNITFLFDPFNDGTNAFVFGINPYGVRREALISEGGANTDNWQSAWDNRWEGAAQIHDSSGLAGSSA